MAPRPDSSSHNWPSCQRGEWGMDSPSSRVWLVSMSSSTPPSALCAPALVGVGGGQCGDVARPPVAQRQAVQVAAVGRRIGADEGRTPARHEAVLAVQRAQAREAGVDHVPPPACRPDRWSPAARRPARAAAAASSGCGRCGARRRRRAVEFRTGRGTWFAGRCGCRNRCRFRCRYRATSRQQKRGFLDSRPCAWAAAARSLAKPSRAIDVTGPAAADLLVASGQQE
jgi:hypothetical protein